MKIAYTVSSGELLIRNIKISLASVEKFFQPKEIIIFYTPPYKPEDKVFLSKYELRERPKMELGGGYDPQMTRSYFEEIEDDILFFLDTDTEMFRDPRDLLEGDWDIRCEARTDVEGYEAHIGTQFFIFKNGTHRKIAKLWRQKYLEAESKLSTLLAGPTDEVSLYWAVIESKIKVMSLPSGSLTGDQIPKHPELLPSKDTYVIHYGLSGKK
jgi:hypothetical protein